MDYISYFAALDAATEFGRESIIKEIMDAMSGEDFIFNQNVYIESFETKITKLTKVCTQLFVEITNGDEFSIGLLNTEELLMLHKLIVW